MATNDARLRFAGELAELLTSSSNLGEVRYPVDRRASIKDVIEALGVPHTEVYSISSGGDEWDFTLAIEPGMDVTFLPADKTPGYPVDVTVSTLLRPTPLTALRFLVDENVAGLVPPLRALGFDTAYDRAWSDADIAIIASDEDRVVLSRDRALLKRTTITHARLIRSQHVDTQLLEVLNHFTPHPSNKAFSRCLRCNIPTIPVDKARIIDRLEPKTRKHYNHFRTCPRCNRIYWRGSHHDNLMKRFIKLGVNMSHFLP